MEMNIKNFKQCETCKIEEAKTLCPQCYSYYCDSCFEFVHNKKKNNNHNKETIDYFVPMDVKCPDHEGNRMSLFCVDEKGNNIIYKLFF